MDSDVAESLEESPRAELTGPQVTARRWQLATVGLIVVVSDQLTKRWALNRLESDSIEGPFGSSLRLVYNRGSAFSLGEGFGPVFGVLAVLISISLFVIVKKIDARAVVFGLGLILGGAMGNVLDRLFREGDGFMSGAVIDFLEIGDWWPVFNIADAAIVVGGIIVALLGARD